MVLLPTKSPTVGLLIFVWLLFVALSSFSSTNLVDAYAVRYASLDIDVGVPDFKSTGLCPSKDPASHTMMPKTTSFHTLAYKTYVDAGFSQIAPIGGSAHQAACLDQNCSWEFDHGLYEGRELTFFWGVLFKGIEKTREQPGVFNNFVRGSTPIWWDNVSYWGKRQTYMAKDGTWGNIEINHQFKEWICEYYELDKSDYDFFPTFPDGNLIVRGKDGQAYRCGKVIKTDDQGRWILHSCDNGLPWHLKLTIALLLTVAVIILIIGILYFIKKRRMKKKEEELNKRLSRGLENPARIPTQSQINMSQFGSTVLQEMSNPHISTRF